MKKRTLTVPVGHASARKSWTESALVVEGGGKKAVIPIREPWELRYLRLQLDLIEEHWKSRIAELSQS